ncbi:ZIP family metal transporter [Symmachiella macrocystis]|uniref:ZIP family metal transporter n=1 Tax=Symmachiella macrocystis TaxID=2527985 RepID=UPI0011B7DBD8|nr:ZIP family metal transporter [Symmachiella macrocystis]
MTLIKWFYFVAIFLCVVAGGIAPFAQPMTARKSAGLPKGEAFTSGVFLALALTMMLPSAYSVFHQALPGIEYPVASVIAVATFLILLATEHLLSHLADDSLPSPDEVRTPAIIPIMLTAMIALPSFFLGAALGISDRFAAFLIFIAVILHKGTAAFALALTTVRSTLTRKQGILLLTCFALTTPMGIVAGELAGKYMSGNALLIKAVVLSLGAGAFLYMGTLHELKRAPLIEHCCKLSCFLWMLAGLLITAAVRWIVGEAHSL